MSYIADECFRLVKYSILLGHCVREIRGMCGYMPRLLLYRCNTQGLAWPHCASHTTNQEDSMIKVKLGIFGFLTIYIYIYIYISLVDLCVVQGHCGRRETKAYSFLASARGLGYRAMPPYLWS